MAEVERERRRERVIGHARTTASRGRSALAEIVETAVQLDEDERVIAARFLRKMLADHRSILPEVVSEKDAGSAFLSYRDAALERARERGRTSAAVTLSSPDMLSAQEIAERLGVTRMTVNAWRKAGRLIGLSGAKRGYRFPAWQLDEHGRPFAQLPRLLELLDGSGWAVHRFMTSPQPELGGSTGRDALGEGRGEAALQAAESIARGTFA
ncbi:helix-turn-helix domain-containing protein [Salinarimonas chemoclinalis]|uniref:helix-turn-helix domain-containing protein n=1 Tax=Salinarimonas chemoclinalis TaxID=3241599 RepID=UPI0035575E21